LLYVIAYVVIATIWVVINKGWKKESFGVGITYIGIAIGWWMCIMIFALIFRSKIENWEESGNGCLFNLFFWLTIALFGLGIYGLILIGVE
jgi:hypothetical protein